jgi:hypothetical protein
MEASAFAIGEIVVVKRSNGSFCFAKIEKFNNKLGTYDVSLDTGDAKNPASSMKSGLIPKHLGKIVQEPNKIVIMLGMDCKKCLTDQTALALSNAQAVAFKYRAREVQPLHLAIYFLERNRWCLNLVQQTGIESPRLVQLLNSKASQHAAAMQSATVLATSEQIGASQKLNYALAQAKAAGAGGIIEIPQANEIPPPPSCSPSVRKNCIVQ